jgi:hypothetical protein
MEFKVEQQKANQECSTCPHIDEWRVEVTINGKTTVSMYGYDPTEELTAKQAALLSGNPVEVAPVITEVSLDDAQAALDELDKEAVTNPNQLEIDTLTAKLEEVTDKKERTKIKNRIQYLKRFV